MMTDPIADMLTRIRNANAIGRKTVEMSASRLRVNMARVLQEEGFIASHEVHEGKPSSTLELTLKYGQDGEKVIRHIERISKPGLRVYFSVDKLTPVLNGQGIHILTTPQGVISDRKARELKVAGEVLAKVY